MNNYALYKMHYILNALLLIYNTYIALNAFCFNCLGTLHHLLHQTLVMDTNRWRQSWGVDMYGSGSGCLLSTLLAQMVLCSTTGEELLMKQKNILLPGLIRLGNFFNWSSQAGDRNLAYITVPVAVTSIPHFHYHCILGNWGYWCLAMNGITFINFVCVSKWLLFWCRVMTVPQMIRNSWCIMWKHIGFSFFWTYMYSTGQM